MLAQSAQWSDTDGHIRPFQLHRDLNGLATLIEAAFGHELQEAHSHIVRDMRQMALMGPLLLAAGAVAPFTGFVWIEDGRLVGNVSYGRESRGIAACSISNVAVLPEYRGRGIASRLLDTALEHLARQGCRRVFLEVRADNDPAKSLYRKRGFTVYNTVHEQYLSGYSWPVILGEPARPLRRVRARDAAELYRLYLASTPRAVLRARPRTADDFRRGLGWRLRGLGRYLLSGERREERVGEAGGRIVALGAMTAYATRRPWEIDLMVAPEHRGTWERPLLEALLARWPLGALADARATTPAFHPEAIEALASLGFSTQRVLDQMVLDVAG